MSNQLTPAPQISYIYCLLHPVTQELRYVGKSLDPVKRLRQHRSIAKSHPNGNRLNTWIWSMSKKGLKPEIVIVEECQGDEWAEAETFWIVQFRALGFDLVNHCEGGGGIHNPTPETRAKMKESQIKYAASAEGRATHAKRAAKQAESSKGEGNPFYGKKHSEETKEKIRKARLANPVSARTYIVTSPEGEEFEVTNLSAFCREYGLSRKSVGQVSEGKINSAYGWKVRKSAALMEYAASAEGKADSARRADVARRASQNQNRTKHSDEAKGRMSKIRFANPTRAKTWIVTSPEGEELKVTNLSAFCRKHGLRRKSFNKEKTICCGGWTARLCE